MKRNKTWCVAGVAALVATGSLAHAQETGNAPVKSETVASPAANGQTAIFNQQRQSWQQDWMPGNPTGPDCAQCPMYKSGVCPTCSKVERAVPLCEKCGLFVRVNSDAEAQQVLSRECPHCSGGGQSPERIGIDDPLADRESDDACDCSLCQRASTRIANAKRLPGAVSFVSENASELADQRNRLAAELTQYLTSQQRDPDHVREVLQMALETTADEAHRAARTSELTETFEVETPVQPDVAELHFEMAETRRMIVETQRDLQLMNESLRFLARHLREDETSPVARTERPATGNRWESRPTAEPPRVASELDRIRQLQQEVYRLEQQVRDSQSRSGSVAGRARTEQPLASSWNDQGKLRPAAWESQPLLPRNRDDRPLRPAGDKIERIWKRYYVGDLITHPVPSSTLRLMQHIKTSIAPDSWPAESIQIASPSVSLLILQTPGNHRRIEVMLREMGGMLK